MVDKRQQQLQRRVGRGKYDFFPTCKMSVERSNLFKAMNILRRKINRFFYVVEHQPIGYELAKRSPKLVHLP